MLTHTILLLGGQALSRAKVCDLDVTTAALAVPGDQYMHPRNAHCSHCCEWCGGKSGPFLTWGLHLDEAHNNVIRHQCTSIHSLLCLHMPDCLSWGQSVLLYPVPDELAWHLDW